MKLRAASPMVPVNDIAASITFWTDALGFHARYVDDVYGQLCRDASVVRLVRAGPDIDIDMDDPKRQLSCYNDVEDIDALHDSPAPALSRLPESRYRPQFSQGYDMREFHVIHGAPLIFLGAAIAESGMP